MMKKKVFHVSFFKSWKRKMQELLQTGSTKDLQPEARIESREGIRPSLAVGREGILLWMQFRIQPMMVALEAGLGKVFKSEKKNHFCGGDERIKKESRPNSFQVLCFYRDRGCCENLRWRKEFFD